MSTVVVVVSTSAVSSADLTSMEEVWKDYMSLQPSLISSHDHHQPSGAGASPPAPPSFSSPPLQPPTTLSLMSSTTLEFTNLGGGGAGSASTSGDDSRDLMMVFSFAPADQYRYHRYQSIMKPQSSSSSAGAGDSSSRRQRRMIKNRESAARSRARRQAYTNELEMELAHLRRENEMLLIKHHQQAELNNARLAQVPAHYISSTLQRCRSAPPA